MLLEEFTVGKSQIGTNIICLYQSAISSFKKRIAYVDFYIKIQQCKW